MNKKTVVDAWGHILNVSVYDEVEEVKGVIHVSYGVNEHSLRYEEFAAFMNQNGYVVYVHDHFEQGLSRGDSDVVKFGKKGPKILVDGVKKVLDLIEQDYPNIDIYAFGHSMGALIIRNYLFEENRYKKVILSGTGYTLQKGLNLAIGIGKFLKLFGDKPSKYFDNIFRQTQLRIYEKTEIDHFIEWLTRDKKMNELDKKDPYLFIRLTKSSFITLLQLIKKANDLRFINLYKNIEFYLISGSHDPSTFFGEGTLKLDKIFNVANNSECKLYNKARHDLVHETNRKEIFKDILNFVSV